MKKRILKFASAGILLAFLSSCSVSVPVAFSNATIGAKKGVSTSLVVFGIDLNQNYGVKDAAKNGKITSAIATVDQKTTRYFSVLVMQKELIVTAE